jgi:glutamate racemase
LNTSVELRDAPLGVFDSGLGGLTVVHALRKRLPDENILYLGDTARVPYGTRSPDTVLKYARGSATRLTSRGIKGLVIACNTVSAVALDMLRAELDLPVLGVIEPGARAAVRLCDELGAARDDRALRVGVLGTTSTILSGAYPRAVGAVSSRVEVVAQAAPLLVPLTEEGWLEGDVPRLAVERYLEPLIARDVGVLVLGCTHYPLLKPLIEEVAARLAGRPVAVVDSAEATADSVAELLAARELDRTGRSGRLDLMVTDLPASFSAVAGRFLREEAASVTQIDL